LTRGPDRDDDGGRTIVVPGLGIDVERSEARQTFRLRFSSTLPLSYRDELERLVFFNPAQALYKEPLVAAVNKYGVPSIVEDGATLRLAVPVFRSIQSLYALDESEATEVLAGVAMFVRENEDTMLLLHLALHESYAAGGEKGGEWLAARMMSALRAICLQTHGLKFLRVLYPKATVLTIK
jgi:hypothetical protein